MSAQALSGGFDTPAIEAASAFRAVMQAMAKPGSIWDITGTMPPAPLSIAAGTTVLTLCDADTPVYLAGELDNDDIRSWISFHTGAPFVGAERAMFAIGNWAALAPISQFQQGTPEYPDRSATLIVERPNMEGVDANLKGPGIKDSQTCELPELDAFQNNHSQFPLGLDFIFTSGSQVMALPRSTEVLACM